MYDYGNHPFEHHDHNLQPSLWLEFQKQYTYDLDHSFFCVKNDVCWI
jgi:hypothetical protein